MFEDEVALVILDRMPVNPGHMLVIPRRHARDLLELAPNEIQRMGLLAQRCAQALRDVLGVQATNLVMSNGEAADQDVPHAHLHVIPRQANDGYEFREDITRYPLAPLPTNARKRLQRAFE